MSLEAGNEGRLDFVLCARCLRTEASFDVVSEAPAVSIEPDGELVAGLEQEVRLALTTGSRHIQGVSESWEQRLLYKSRRNLGVSHRNLQ